MSLVFPSSPSVGQLTFTGGQTWRWTGTTWTIVGTSGYQGSAGTSGLTASSSNTQVLFNDSTFSNGSFAFVFNKSTNTVGIGSNTQPSDSAIALVVNSAGAALSGGGIQMTANNNGGGAIQGSIGGGLQFWVHTGPIGTEVYTEPMIIVANGNIGINNKTPNTNLSVVGTLSYTTGLYATQTGGVSYSIIPGYLGINYNTFTITPGDTITIQPTGQWVIGNI